MLHGLAQSSADQAVYDLLLTKLQPFYNEVSFKDHAGNTPLQYAARRGNIAFINFVIKHISHSDIAIWQQQKTENGKNLLYLVLEDLNKKIRVVSDSHIDVINFFLQACCRYAY